MSTDELVRGIRRIVGDRDAKPTGLADAEARKAIGISRGVGFIRADGTVGGSGAEGGGKDSSPPDVPADQPDSGGGVPADAGGTTGGGDAGGKTVLSGDAATVDDATVDNTALGSVTGTDPATGNITSVKFDSLAGIEYVPPTGWYSPESEQGFADEYTGATLTPANACATIGCPSSNVKGFRGATIWEASTGYAFTIGYWQTGPSSFAYPAGFDTSGFVTCLSCGPDSDGDFFPSVLRSLVTTSEPPAVIDPSDHPSDGVCAIAYDHDEGGYKGHTKDPDCSAAQKTASNFVIIRSQSDPSRYFRYTRLANGGTKVTEVDSGGVPKPGTVTKLLDGQGNVVGFVDVSLDALYQ